MVLGDKLYAIEIDRKEGETVLQVNFLGAPYSPSISDMPDVMARVIDALADNANVSSVVLVQQKNYHYSFEQTQMLAEIAQVYNFLIKQERVLAPDKMLYIANVSFGPTELTAFLEMLKRDPVACYVSLNRAISKHRAELNELAEHDKSKLYTYVLLLERIREMIGKTKLLERVKGELEFYVSGDRSVYSIFRPDVMPNFTFTRLVAQLPENATLVDQYSLASGEEEITVTVLKRDNDTSYFYHLMPPEYSLSEEHHMLLNLGRNVLIQHQPKSEEFTDPARVRSVFFNIARDLLGELATSKGMGLSYRELTKLAEILVRQTIGFGVLEVLLLDDKIQDIYLNAPISQNVIFIRHSKYGDCLTNIVPSYEDADSWAAKLRLQSGRALDEASPILDTDLVFGEIRARIAAIQRPLSPQGVAYALRRHRDDPWTLPLFIDNKMINSFAAGFLSFCVDGARTLLIAGTRSSGKTSLLGAMMLEILPNVRALIIEDTLELPVDALRKIGYNVQRMKVRSALTETTTEIDAAEGIRASLRLGDSALVVGEVRSVEAKALYEAMRVGALANVVAGTIHGPSPYGVYDRVVNDLGVPITSFKATDLIIVANPIKTPDGLNSVKRVVQIAEVRKHWTKDPLEEKGFVELFRYNVDKDELEPTDELINGNSEVIKAIAARVKGWAGNWDAVYDNIILRGRIKQEIVDSARRLNKPDLLEAKFNSLSNAVFHRISDQVTRESGLPSSDKVFPLWKEWLATQLD